MVTGGENDLLDHLASTEVNSWSFHCHDNHTCNFHHVDLMIIIMIHGSRLPDHFLHCCHHIMLILLILIIRFWSQQESGFRGFLYPHQENRIARWLLVRKQDIMQTFCFFPDVWI